MNQLNGVGKWKMTLSFKIYLGFNSMDDKFTEQSYNVINALFSQLASIFPAFNKAWPTPIEFEVAKKNWLLALVENNINTMAKLQIGLKKARALDKPWVPSVGQFIEWCKPALKDYGLPEPFEAYREACRNAHEVKYNCNALWTHQAIYDAASRTGMFELEKKQKEFLIYYERACQTVFEGGTLKDLPKLIPNMPEEKRCPKTAKNALNEMLQKLGKTSRM
jgi:hypothetical protein